MSPHPPVRILSDNASLSVECEPREVDLTFRRKSDERAFEKLDAALREQARRVLNAESVGSNGELDYFVLDDWWPNRTIAIELDRSLLTSDLMLGLWNSLAGPYAGWSFAVEVYERFASADPEALGTMRVFAEEVLITRNVVAAVAGEA